MNEKHLVIYVEGYVINRLVSSLSQLQAFSFLNYRLISMNANSKSTDKMAGRSCVQMPSRLFFPTVHQRIRKPPAKRSPHVSPSKQVAVKRARTGHNYYSNSPMALSVLKADLVHSQGETSAMLQH